MQLAWNRFWLGIGALTLTAGTSASCISKAPEAGADGGGDAGGEVREPELLLSLTGQSTWPGNGRALTVRMLDVEGQPVSADTHHALRLYLPGRGDRLPIAVEPISLAPGFTAILLDATAAGPRSDRAIAAIEAFIASRPAEERIGLYRWGVTVEAYADYTDDRRYLSRLLGAHAASLPHVGPQLVRTVAVDEVSVDLTRLGGKSSAAMRAVVVVGGDPGSGFSEAAVPTWSVPVDADTELGLLDASTHLSALMAHGHYRVAVCPPQDATQLAIRVEGSPAQWTVALNNAPPEQAQMACDLASIREGARTYPSTLEMTFSPEQRDAYQERLAAIAALDLELAKSDFDVGFRLAAGEEPIAARAHIRGHGSVLCERKSYTVKLPGPNRHIFPGAGIDELYLISLCDDVRYLNQYSVMPILAELGLFPLRSRLVELVLDGESRGVYLLLDKAPESMVRDNSRVSSVLRRSLGDDGIEYFRVKYARDEMTADDDQRFYSLMQELQPLSGQALSRRLDERMDFDQYLRMLAFNSMFLNGDYVDEVWVMGSDMIAPSGEVTERFRVMGWDHDDIFSECHHGGARALTDPNGLLYCAESLFDYQVLQDPVIYGRYVDTLEQTMADVAPDVVLAAVQGTRNDLLPFFERPAICAAMVELIALNPAAVDCAVASADIAEHTDGFYGDFEERRAALAGLIATYRSTGGLPIPTQSFPIVIPY